VLDGCGAVGLRGRLRPPGRALPAAVGAVFGGEVGAVGGGAAGPHGPYSQPCWRASRIASMRLRVPVLPMAEER
jgi:hypothetical protein